MTVQISKKRTLSGDRIFDIVNKILMTMVVVLCLYPVYYCMMLSFNDGQDMERGMIFLWPRVFTWNNYAVFFRGPDILNAFFVTFMKTIVGTITSVYFTAITAYALTVRELKLRKFYITLGIGSMYFSGGIIPFYLLLKNLNLLDNFLVYIIPFQLYFFNILIFMSFFREITPSLKESAKIDGAHEFTVFNRIILPVSKAVLATITLFISVWHWNAWYESYIYTSDPQLQTLPAILVKMINQNMAESILRSTRSSMGTRVATTTGNSVKLAAMTVAVLPSMIIYPFLQKYLVKGVMIGAVKG